MMLYVNPPILDILVTLDDAGFLCYYEASRAHYLIHPG